MYRLVSQLHVPDTLLVLEGTLASPDVSELCVLRLLAARFFGDKHYDGFKDAVLELRQELDALLVRQPLPSPRRDAIRTVQTTNSKSRVDFYRDPYCSAYCFRSLSSL